MKITFVNYLGNRKTIDVVPENINSMVVDLEDVGTLIINGLDGSYTKVTDYDKDWDEYSKDGSKDGLEDQESHDVRMTAYNNWLDALNIRRTF